MLTRFTERKHPLAFTARAHTRTQAECPATSALKACCCERRSARDAQALLHLLQSKARHAEQLGRARLVALGDLERAPDQAPLQLVDLRAQLQLARAGVAVLGARGPEVLFAQHV